MRKFILILGVLIAFVFVASFAKFALTSEFNFSADPLIECDDAHGAHIRGDTKDIQTFRQCVDTNAKLFLQGDYTESKDFAKTFLTLLSAILVASITFSEKIVDVGRAEAASIAAMISCWALLLFAIVACGVGLALMAAAAGIATYQPELNYLQLQVRAVNLLLSAGVAFGFSLLAMILAGVNSLIQKWKMQERR